MAIAIRIQRRNTLRGPETLFSMDAVPPSPAQHWPWVYINSVMIAADPGTSQRALECVARAAIRTWGRTD